MRFCRLLHTYMCLRRCGFISEHGFLLPLESNFTVMNEHARVLWGNTSVIELATCLCQRKRALVFGYNFLAQAVPGGRAGHWA